MYDRFYILMVSVRCRLAYLFRCARHCSLTIDFSLQSTPLHYASLEGHAACVTALIRSGAQVDAVMDEVRLRSPYYCVISCLTYVIRAQRPLRSHGPKDTPKLSLFWRRW